MGEFKTGQISLRSLKSENKTGRIQSRIQYAMIRITLHYFTIHLNNVYLVIMRPWGWGLTCHDFGYGRTAGVPESHPIHILGEVKKNRPVYIHVLPIAKIALIHILFFKGKRPNTSDSSPKFKCF